MIYKLSPEVLEGQGKSFSLYNIELYSMRSVGNFVANYLVYITYLILINITLETVPSSVFASSITAGDNGFSISINCTTPANVALSFTGDTVDAENGVFINTSEITGGRLEYSYWIRTIPLSKLANRQTLVV